MKHTKTAALRLAEIVDGLNPECLELGPGMMATLKDLAGQVMAELNGTPPNLNRAQRRAQKYRLDLATAALYDILDKCPSPHRTIQTTGDIAAEIALAALKEINPA